MKPIAKFGELPFNVGGISVFAAVDNDLQAIADELFIISERSTRMFDLVTEDTTKVYTFMQMVNRDKQFKELPLSATASEIQSLIGKNQFVVKVYDIDSGDELGYAYKFFPNKIVLSNGKEVDVVDYNKQTTVPAPVVVNVTSVSVLPTTLSGNVGDPDVQLTESVLPANATDKSVTWSTSAPLVATVSSTGLVTYIGTGSATITVKTADGDHTATVAVTVA